MDDANSIQQVLIRHVLDGGSRHAVHFGVQAYKNDPSLAHNGMPSVLLALQRLVGACHGGYDRNMAIEMREEIKRTNRGLSQDGVERQLQLALDKLGYLVEANLKELETYIEQYEGVRYSRVY